MASVAATRLDLQPMRWLRLVGLGALGGGRLFLSDHPVHLGPPQLVALIPLLWAVRSASLGGAAVAGLGHGFVLNAALLVVLRLPLTMGLILALVLSILWVLFAVAARLVWRTPLLGAVAIGAVAV